MESHIEYQSDSNISLSGIISYPESGECEHFCLLCHGLLSGKNGRKFVAISHTLAEEDVGNLRFDFTGHGDSEGSVFWDFDLSRQVKDIQASCNYLHDRFGCQGIPIIGSSIGATAALAYAAVAPMTVNGLVLITPRFDFPFRDFSTLPRYWINQFMYNFLSLSKRVKCPVLIIKAERDQLVDNDFVDLVCKHISSERKMVKIVKDTDHYLRGHAVANEIINLTVNWITRYVFP